MAPSTSLATTIGTLLALIDQFLTSLDLSDSAQSQSQPTTHPSPLPLLTASATSLKSTVTKLSLLTITTPFTPSAVASTLHPLSVSILPSLVTATLLTSPSIFPQSFSKECSSLTRVSLRKLKVLILLIKARFEDGRPKSEVSEAIKQNITEATGKVWEDCDLLVGFANDDVVGFVCKKASQWLELMRDAVKEFEEWDPEEEVDDDPFGIDEAQDDDALNVSGQAEKDLDRAAMSAGVKDQALKVLSRIPQSIHVVVKQRLQQLPKDTTPDSRSPIIPMDVVRRNVLDGIVRNTRRISDCIDESAEAMYMGDPEMCLKKAGEARALTIEVVEAVLEPWQQTEVETKQDQYIKRALAWIQQVEPGGKQTISNSNLKGKSKE